MSFKLGDQGPQGDWQPPRCIHGRIILGCPYEDCPTQTAYLDQMNAAMDAYWLRQEREARAIVRGLLT
jgi:hypothetical protein